jgi:hypothetical protein
MQCVRARQFSGCPGPHGVRLLLGGFFQCKGGRDGVRCVRCRDVQSEVQRYCVRGGPYRYMFSAVYPFDYIKTLTETDTSTFFHCCPQVITSSLPARRPHKPVPRAPLPPSRACPCVRRAPPAPTCRSATPPPACSRLLARLSRGPGRPRPPAQPWASTSTLLPPPPTRPVLWARTHRSAG